MHIFNKIKSTAVFMMFLVLEPASALDSSIPVRVGISNTSFQTYLFDSIEFNEAQNLDVMDAQTGYLIKGTDENSAVKVAMEKNSFSVYINGNLIADNLAGPVLITPKEGKLVSISGLKRKGMQASYRGCIELTKSGKNPDKFAVVNVLSLKNYLKGVVPNEMPVRFGLEALKAQSVAARNYAVTPRVKAYQEFDVCDSVACQVYYGANTESEPADKAIEQTDGIIAVDNENNPILALYSSTAGGYTESYENTFSDPQTKSFPSKHIPYLVSLPDNTEFPKLNTDEEAEKFYTSKPESFDDQSPYYRWSKEWTADELQEVLNKTLIAQSKTGFISPFVSDKSEIGNIKSIKALERGNSGKIIKLEISTDKNTFVIEKELVIRRCFQKNGISLPSANFVINYINSETPVYKFSGGGFGHGVGLSQWGAGKMSSSGYRYDEILKHYYHGIKLATIPVNIFANNKIIESSFYSDLDEAYIKINNPDKISELKITVNEHSFTQKINSGNTNIDISKYLKKGENKVSYLITDDTDFCRKISASVVISGADNE